VLHAQAVEFAKEKEIALYCRATAGGEGETVVRRSPPTRAGGAVGVAAERGLVQIGLPSGQLDAMRGLLAYLEERQAPGKELQLRPPGEGSSGQASLLLSRENLHDLESIVAGFRERGGRVVVRDGVAAVSAIGSGITASLANVRKTLDAAAAIGAPVLGLSTSSFRISVLVEEKHLEALARGLHAGLVEGH
jgi:aspartate kinase